MGQSVSNYPVRSYPDLLFAEPAGHQLRLDLLVPETTECPPLVVHFHGGAWAGGSYKNTTFAWLAQHGFACAAATYRYSDQAKYPAQVHDCKASIRWLRAHARKFEYNAERIGISGCSAGGHLAILLGTTAGSAYHEGTVGEYRDQSSAVQAVVDFFGPADFILRAQTQPEATDPPESRVHRLIGCAPRDNVELAKLASGVYHVSPSSAPFLIFHGGKDTTVLLDQSRKLHQSLKQNGVESELHVLPDGAHAPDPFFNEENRKRIVEFFTRHLCGR